MAKVSIQYSSTRIKVCVLGARGITNVQGGVETHCEQLYPELVKHGCEVTIFTRKPYVHPEPSRYKGVKLIPLSCPKSKYLEAIIHSFKGTIAARKLKPDILHIHAIGPALLTPLARVICGKVVITHHGPDYRRAKWGWFAKLILKIGEWVGITFAQQVIVIADYIAADLKKRFGKKNITVIPNGVSILEPSVTDEILKFFTIEKNSYILGVGRFVPEKGFHDLIEAFNRVQGLGFRMRERQSTVVSPQPLVYRTKINAAENQLSTKKWKLVIVGDADHEDKYSLGLKKQARENSNIILTGFLTGQPLQELYSHAGLFVLPSYYEGLPIALLEAMSYGISCVASDIPANRNVALSNDRYFKAGDIDALAEKLEEFVKIPLSNLEKKAQVARISEKYNWEINAKRTLEVYETVLCSRRSM